MNVREAAAFFAKLEKEGHGDLDVVEDGRGHSNYADTLTDGNVQTYNTCVEGDPGPEEKVVLLVFEQSSSHML